MASSCLFNRETQAVIFNFKPNAVQRMLDFDTLCGRDIPSVGALVLPQSAGGFHKAFFKGTEVLIPIYNSTKLAAKKHPSIKVFISQSSERSAYPTTKDAIEIESFDVIVIIAEGIPEHHTLELIEYAKQHNKIIIGPATVGAITAGAFKVANTAGTPGNIIASRLYRPGSVGFVSKSGGMSNEMYNVINQNSDGILEGIAIGGDRYPGSTLVDHLRRFEKIDEVKFSVFLGEIGGGDEYEIIKALGELKKPIVGYIAGWCADYLPPNIQFGHAGARSGESGGSAPEKSEALAKAGVKIARNYEEFPVLIKETYDELIAKGTIKPKEEPPLPEQLPKEYKDIVKAIKIRKPATVVSSISCDIGDELTYNHVKISELIQGGKTIGDVIGHLWFKRELPKHASEFIMKCLMIAADHGAAVSGAHNAIIAARAGRDLVSSVASGMLTIGPRFGGAVSGAAKYMKYGLDKDMTATEFVSYMKSINVRIPGIGHRVKTTENPDIRVVLLKEASKDFKDLSLLKFALEVEKVTTKKAKNLILNVDGCIGVLLVDLMRSIGMDDDEVNVAIDADTLNGVFVLARTIGMIGHVIDQKRLNQGLYRHDTTDILYL